MMPFLAALLLAAAVLPAPAEDPSPKRTKFDPARDAAKDIEQAVRLASASGRRVLLDVGGEWCVWWRVEKTIHKQPDRVRCAMNGFVIAVGCYGRS